ncbi:MAG TPA: thioredoxin domain-containing protein [Acidobacteriaceae bacterium]|nr:thioredoxin domain-containing protein [Acidobacteriaceae bacterium]
MAEHINALAHSSSAYLRSAMHQPVQWFQWSPEAFRRAAAENKPILLDIGAVWCHWCHVMDRESYEDAATARFINENFIAVKVDRDERPDVDTRYQAAVAAIAGQGGWPLTAFLTPDGRPYFGGTYFPPEDRYGRPSFQRVLQTMADAFKNRRSEVDESAGSVMQAIEYNESFSGRGGSVGPELVEKIVEACVKQFDTRFGGFGSQPKFPHAAAIDLLMDFAQRSVNETAAEKAKEAALITLEKMALGGIYDHLAGGFHRYSVDERWVVPHFEKMAYDNSELLKNYVHAFQTFVVPECAAVARDIIRWMDEWLTDREHGGFYASQDADFSLDDDGDYFTWTRDEAAEVLTKEELAIAGLYFDIGEIGDMHHNPAKNVLHINHGPEEIAKRLGITPRQVMATVEEAKKKLYAARLKRPTPYVDKTIYVSWNGMCISAYIVAGRVLNLPLVCEFALKSLDRVLAHGWDKTLGLAHVIAYGDISQPAVRVSGMLDDYVFIAHACLDAWECTGEIKYYEAASEITESMIARFHDLTGGGFFDTQPPVEGEKVLGALTARRKPLQDTPTPAGNPMAAALLFRMESLNGRTDYTVKAEDTIESFAGVVEHFGLYAGTFGLAMQRMVQPPVQVCVIGDDAEARSLEAVAMARFAINKSVVRLRFDQLGALPPSLAETLPYLPGVAEGHLPRKSFAAVCSGSACLPPVTSIEQLLASLNEAL